jgi:hypothetical protein
MSNRFPRISALRILAVLMMCLPLALTAEWASIQYIKRRQMQEYVPDGTYKMRMLAIAAIQYAVEHDDHYPSADRWEQELRPYLEPGMALPLKDVLGRGPTRIVMNRELSGKNQYTLERPSEVILFFEVPVGTPGSGLSLEAMVTRKNAEGSLYCWADGHVYYRAIGDRDWLIGRSREYMRVAAGR